MNTGNTLFAQIMDFLPWKTFHRIVTRHGGDKGVRSLNCAEHSDSESQISYALKTTKNSIPISQAQTTPIFLQQI